MNKVLGYLPIFIFVCYCVLLLALLGSVQWYYDNARLIEDIDFIACLVMLIHALFNWNSYHYFAKSSFITIIALALYHIIYYNFVMSNYVYYYFYTNILASNWIYGIIKSK